MVIACMVLSIAARVASLRHSAIDIRLVSLNASFI